MFFPHIATSDHMSIWIIYMKAVHYPNINITQTLKYSTAQKERKRSCIFLYQSHNLVEVPEGNCLVCAGLQEVSFLPFLSVNRANKPRYVLPAKLTITVVPKPQIIFPSCSRLFLHNLSCSKLFRQHRGCTNSGSGFCYSLQMGLRCLHQHKNINSHVVSSSGWLESVAFPLEFSCPFVFATIEVQTRGKVKKLWSLSVEKELW